MPVEKQPRLKELSMLSRRSPTVQLASLAGTQQYNRSTPSQANAQQLTPQNVLYLQRTIGNAAVQRLLADEQSDKPAAAGNVRQHTPSTLQPQLKVGPANDEFEREADDISRQVVQRASTSRVQRSTTSAANVAQRVGQSIKSLKARFTKASVVVPPSQMVYAIRLNQNLARICLMSKCIRTANRLI